MGSRYHHCPSLLRLQVCAAAVILVWITSSPEARCWAKDTLSKGEILRINETLVSRTNQTYEFGFFSLGSNATGAGLRYYIGTWFYNITPRVYVWVGNRDAPFPSAGAEGYTISLSDDSRLKVLKSASGELWSTGTPPRWDSTWVAVLSDEGNLAIQKAGGAGDTGDDDTPWQSFAFPTDTFLEGMKIAMNETSRNGTTFTSWVSDDEPRPGNYTMGMDPAPGSTQLYIRGHDGRIRWRSGVFDGTYFNGVSGMRPLFDDGFKLLRELDSSGKSITFRYVNRTQMRFQLLPNGTETAYIYEAAKGTWKPIWQQPTRDCEFYNFCGNNSFCARGQGPGVCQCLPGFVPAGGWNANGNSSSSHPSGRCVRSTALLAQQRTGNSETSTAADTSGAAGGGIGNSKPDGMWPMQSMKLPDFAVKNTTVAGPDDCRKSCIEDQSCSACSYLTGCYTWSGDLADMFQFTDASDNGAAVARASGATLFVRLAGSEIERLNGTNTGRRSHHHLALVLAATLSASALLAALLCAAVGWRYNLFGIRDLWRRGRSVDPSAGSAYSGDQQPAPKDHLSITTAEYAAGASGGGGGGGEDASSLAGAVGIAESGRSNPPFELPLFTLEEIDAATGSFRESSTLGKGGFGHVYKGVLPGGELVAVKRLSKDSGQGQEEFKNEAALIARLQHNNLVRLQGCCIQGDERILVYEYMPNKSLDAFLFSPTKQPLLDWRRRFNIIEGIARGLLYLHRDSRLRIVHRDLKASNILLDDDMNPKISDFGMARIFGNTQNQDNTNRIVGTFGYMSPEYAMEGLFSDKSDVYSFGVLTIEIISGRKNNRFRTEDHNNLLAYAWQLWQEGRVLELVDPSIHNSCYFDQLIRCVHIALLCVQDRASDRPKMSKVVIMLASDTAIPIMPKQPTFSAIGSSSDTVTRYNDDVFSNNDVTITELTGR